MWFNVYGGVCGLMCMEVCVLVCVCVWSFSLSLSMTSFLKFTALFFVFQDLHTSRLSMHITECGHLLHL